MRKKINKNAAFKIHNPYWRHNGQERSIRKLVDNIGKNNLDLSENQEWLVDNLCSIFDVDAGALLLFSENNVQHVLKKSHNKKVTWRYYDQIEWPGGIVEEHIKNNKALILNPPLEKQSLRWIGDQQDFSIASLILEPIQIFDQIIGTLALFNKNHGKFNIHDQGLIHFIGNAIAYTIYSSRLIQKLKVTNADLEVNHWHLLRSRNILRALFDSIPTSLYIIDRNYSLIAVNLYRANRLNIPPNALVGRRCFEALYQREDVCPDCRVIESFFGGINTNRDKREWLKEDDPIEWEISTYPIYDDTNQIVQAILLEQDVTEKRRLEVNLAQSEKLAAVGQLAAGLAHEINNPLTAIIANTQLLQRELVDDADNLELVDLINKAGVRATQVVRNLLDLARKEEYTFVAININSTIRKALDMLKHELVAHNINLLEDLDDKLSSVMASEDHLQSVWMNLISNAIDAVEENENREIQITSAQQGNEVRITVSDNGKGIPQEKIGRIFEPFYTTKSPGHGTGLGLSLCHRMIKQHGGNINVDSQLGVGTIFSVTLPVS
jgi:two-component system NtrC family sensor kinase